MPAVRIIQGILDRKFHIRCAKLRDDRAVHELYHGMDDTLRLYHDLNIFWFHTKEPAGLHHFQSLIDQSCRINGNLSSHGPVGMLQCILHLDIFQFFFFLSEERAAGCRQKNLLQLILMLTVQALENGAVLAVHRENFHMTLFCQRHDNVSCGYQSLFICQRNVFSRFHGCNGRTDTNHTDDSRYQNLRCRVCCHFQKSIHTGYDFYRKILYPIP